MADTSPNTHVSDFEQRPVAPTRTLVLEPWRADSARAVKAAYIIAERKPAGMPLDRVRRSAALSIAAGAATLICPSSGAGCESDVGVFVALTVLHRPERWFAWGGLVDGLSVGQMWQQTNTRLLLTHQAATGRVLAELHPVADYYGFDAYFGIGLGVGLIASAAQAQLRNNDESLDAKNAATARTTTWSPFYSARLGVDLQLSERTSFGAVADWSNFQALTGENCPWKAFGMCSSSGWGAFPADNAVWKLGAALSFAFGQEL